MFKSVVKVCGSTVKLQLILDILSAVEAGGIRGVAVSGIYQIIAVVVSLIHPSVTQS